MSFSYGSLSRYSLRPHRFPVLCGVYVSCETVTNCQVKQIEQVKEKEVIWEIGNIWKRSKNKLKTDRNNIILYTSNSYMGTQTNEQPLQRRSNKPPLRHATILRGESVFVKRKSVSIRIIHQCIDVSRHFARDSHHTKKFRYCVIK